MTSSKTRSGNSLQISHLTGSSQICSPLWVDEVAQEKNIPVIVFYVFTAALAVFLGSAEYLAGEGLGRVRPSPESLTRKPPWVDFHTTVAYKMHEARAVYAGAYGENASGITDGQRFARLINAAKAFVMPSCPEFESDFLNLYAQITRKPALPLGFLPPEKLTETRSIHVLTDAFWNKIFQWLEEQSPKSVVFVGFGSECKLSKDQIHEIAYGLELSGLPFLWALQKPSWEGNETDVLPSGFSSRLSGKGVAHIGWAPQREILAHPSIGGCLFHAGWGSVIESLQYGHCLVMLPFILDQGLNARLVVERGLGIEVERAEDGSFSRDDVAEWLTRAMAPNDGGGGAATLRSRAAEAAALFGDQKLNDYYIEQFVEYLKNNGRVQK